MLTADELHLYIDTFVSTLQTTAAALPEEIRPQLLHLSLLPARIIGYISDQFGVAIEYEAAAATTVEIQQGSDRVEDLLVRAPAELRSVGPMVTFAEPNCGMARFTLTGAFPFRLANERASLTLAEVAFSTGAWRREIRFAEVFGDRSASTWSEAAAVSRAKDEVLAAAVEFARARERDVSIPEYIGRFKQKTVLVLGDYSAGSERLARIAQGLRQLGYDPLLAEDIPDHPHQSLSQKVVAIGTISRFVVVDDSSRSGHLAEVPLCQANGWVTILLRAAGGDPSYMTAGASLLSNVIRERSYDTDSLETVLAESCAWAEQKLAELQRTFESTYPWRRPG